MRKYFLLAGVALTAMAASNVNTAMAYEYADVEVNAQIFHLNRVECSNLNFGEIHIMTNRSGPATIKLNTDGTIEKSSEAVDRVLNSSVAKCQSSMGGLLNYAELPEEVILTNSNDETTLSVTDFTSNHGSYSIGATLNIEDTATVPTGTYTGSFTIVTPY